MIIFDEIDYAESILRNGCSKRNVLVDFKILAKYFLYHKNKTEQETRELMLEALKDSQTFIPINYLILKIDKAIIFAKTEKLKTMEPVTVYKEELDCINKLPEEIQNLAFVYLFLSKWAQDEKGFFIKESDIKKLLGLSNIRNKDLQIMNKTLEDNKFIKFVDTRTKELIKVLINGVVGEEALKISDFNNPVLHYREYVGDKIGKCQECGCLIKMTTSNNKYCKDCRRLVKNKQTNNSKQKKNKSL